jgi:cell division septation protein DedD
MPKNEDGEFELVLGNRQLLSVFFIVVVLLGVFFTMGYIVGRNSGPAPSTEIASAHREPAKPPIVVESASQEKKADPPPQETKPPETKPQVETAKAPEPEPKKPEPKKPEPPPAKEKEKESGTPATGGTYLQLSATNQHEAEVYVDVLKKKGFKAITSAVPDRPGLVRVWVGPIADNGIAKMRADLNAAGFPGDKAIVKR